MKYGPSVSSPCNSWANRVRETCRHIEAPANSQAGIIGVVTTFLDAFLQKGHVAINSIGGRVECQKDARKSETHRMLQWLGFVIMDVYKRKRKENTKLQPAEERK